MIDPTNLYLAFMKRLYGKPYAGIRNCKNWRFSRYSLALKQNQFCYNHSKAYYFFNE
jgi:hypothetical protein